MKSTAITNAVVENNEVAAVGPIRLIGYKGENVKGLEVLDVHVGDGTGVLLQGKQTAGKSAAIELLEWLIRGKASQDKGQEFIRRGTKKASGEADFSGKVKILRSETKAGTTNLKVFVGDEPVRGGGQKWIDRLFGTQTLDPLSFVESRDQVGDLQKLLGLDFSDLNKKRDDAYQQRTLVGRERDREQAKLEAMPRHDDVPEAEVTLTDLNAKRDRVKEKNDLEWAVLKERKAQQEMLGERRREIEAELDNIGSEIDASAQEVTRLDEQVAMYERELARAKEARARADKAQTDLMLKRERVAQEYEELPEPAIAEITEEMKTAQSVLKDRMAVMDGEIAAVEGTNQKVRDNKRRAEQAEVVAGKMNEYSAFTTTINSVDTEKAERIAACEFPIDGLSFGEDKSGNPCILYQGLPLRQNASQGEQIRVSTAIMLAQHKSQHPETAPIVTIDKASLLDSENIDMIVGMVAEAGGVVLLERTTDDASLVVSIIGGDENAA